MADPTVNTTNPLPPFAQNFVAGIARHLLTAIAGGMMMAAGLTTNTQAQIITICVGVVVWAVGLLWSIVEKYANSNPAVAIITNTVAAVESYSQAKADATAVQNQLHPYVPGSSQYDQPITVTPLPPVPGAVTA